MKFVRSAEFHLPGGDIMLNNITSDVHDSEAMCPEYKVVACRIRKSKGSSSISPLQSYENMLALREGESGYCIALQSAATPWSSRNHQRRPGGNAFLPGDG